MRKSAQKYITLSEDSYFAQEQYTTELPTKSLK